MGGNDVGNGWTPAEVTHILDQLITAGEIRGGLQIESQAGEWYAVPELP